VVVRVRDPLLGTRCEVEATGDRVIADTAELTILDEVERLETVFTLYDPSSAMNALRRTGATTSQQLREVWALADYWYERTSGLFHPALQPLADEWADADKTDATPTAEALAEAVRSLDSTNARHLDFNALAKGWITDRGLTAAFEGVEPPASAWLSLGGDLVHRGTGLVHVGIEDPARPYDNVAPLVTIDVSNEALATSGTVHRYWTIEGRRFSRVLDPRTGSPVGHVHSATVVAATAATADVLATVALIGEPNETLDLVAREDAECFLVLANGTTMQSSDRFRRE